ncbi:MAG: AI-2E family transporter [Actinomycetota bacterium]
MTLLSGETTDGRRPLVPAALERAAAVGLRVLIVVAAGFLLLRALVALRLVVLPIIAALFFTTGLAPIVKRLRSAGVPGAPATLLAMLSAIAVLTAFVGLLGVELADQSDELGTVARDGTDDVVAWVAELPIGMSERELERSLDDAIDSLGSTAADRATEAAFTAFEVIAGILLTLPLTFFFVKDGRRIAAWLTERLVPPRHRDTAFEVEEKAWETLGGYLRGTATMGVIEGLIIGVTLFILDAPLVLPLALLTFFGAFFPLVGATAAGVVAGLVVLATNGVGDALIVGAVVIAVQQLDGDLLAPLVLGRAVRLHPLVILLALTAGAVLGGAVGAFLSVPVTAVAVVSAAAIRRRCAETDDERAWSEIEVERP